MCASVHNSVQRGGNGSQGQPNQRPNQANAGLSQNDPLGQSTGNKQAFDGVGRDFEVEVKDKLTVGLAALPETVRVRHLKTSQIKLPAITQQILNDAWKSSGLLPVKANNAGDNEFFQGDTLQLDIGVVIEPVDPASAPLPIDLKMDIFGMKLKSPCILFGETTVSNSIEKLRQKVVQCCKNRLAFEVAPTLFIDDGHVFAGGDLLPLGKYAHYNKYLAVISNFEIDSGIQNFDIAYLNIVKQPPFRKALSRLADVADLTSDARVLSVMQTSLISRRRENCRILHLSIQSQHGHDYGLLAREVKGLKSVTENIQKTVHGLKVRMDNSDDRFDALIDSLAITNMIDPVFFRQRLAEKQRQRIENQRLERQGVIAENEPVARPHQAPVLHLGAGPEALNREPAQVQEGALVDPHLRLIEYQANLLPPNGPETKLIVENNSRLADNDESSSVGFAECILCVASFVVLGYLQFSDN